MYNLDDKDLDRLSKEAADNYLPPGAPSWEGLHQRLDKELPPQKEKKRRGIIVFFLLAALLGAGLFWYGRNLMIPAKEPVAAKGNKPAAETVKNVPAPVTNASPADNSKTTSPNATAQQQASLKKGPVTATTPAKTNMVTTIAKTTDKTISENNNYQPAKLPVKKEKQAPGIAIASGKKEKDKGSFKSNQLKLTAKGNKAKNEIAEQETPLQNNPEKVKNDIVSDNTPPAEDIAKNSTPVTSTTPADKTIAKPQEDKKEQETPKATATITKAKDKKAKGKNGAFAIGVTGGMDFSTVKYKYFDKMGYNIGLMAGYYFNENWSVYTGLIYTKKNYKIDNKDYNPPTVLTGVESVDGYCNMWELPVQARYTFNSKPSSKLFVSAGLSSYFMKLQHYNYNYKSSSGGSSYTHTWDYTEHQNFWFSTLHLSAGVVKPLGGNWNWQIEPYAKIPVKGVGLGKINLTSFGVNLTFQYKQSRKK